LSSMLEVNKFNRVLLQPANPKTGRCIRNGIYYINDIKLEDTGFAIDPDFPANDSQVNNILMMRSVQHNYITDIHVSVNAKMDRNGVLIPDCSSENDLQNSLINVNEKTILCGSAAFFEQVLIKSGFSKKENTSKDIKLTSHFLLILGSTHPINIEFKEKLNLQNYQVDSFPESMLEVSMDDSLLDDWVDFLVKSWNQNKNLIIALSDKKIDFPHCSSVLKERMDRVVSKLFQKCQINELIIGGGATAYSILDALKFNSLLPVKELAPGTLKMQVLQQPDLFLTLKPGSYPWPEKLLAN